MRTLQAVGKYNISVERMLSYGPPMSPDSYRLKAKMQALREAMPEDIKEDMTMMMAAGVGVNAACAPGVTNTHEGEGEGESMYSAQYVAKRSPLFARKQPPTFSFQSEMMAFKGSLDSLRSSTECILEYDEPDDEQ